MGSLKIVFYQSYGIVKCFFLSMGGGSLNFFFIVISPIKKNSAILWGSLNFFFINPMGSLNVFFYQWGGDR